MKLKQVTLIALFIFFGFFITLAVFPAKNSDTLIIENSEKPIDVKSAENTNTEINTGINTKPSVPVPVKKPAVDNTKILTLANIAKHNTVTDCYLIIKGRVHNVTSFISKHPGGKKKIADMCGKEATKIFTTIHSNFAWNLLKDYDIGPVVGN